MKIKLIIWDLDDTIWTGTLAEGDNVQVLPFRANIIRQLNRHGIVSAICSKNHFPEAKAKLVELELWSDFVFCRIAFTPKGEAVRQIIQDMQLRAANTLFVDDNAVNLAEVAYVNPEINILDATQPECDVVLQRILDENLHVTKSRVEEYRILEERLCNEQASSLDREQFLQSCLIKVCLIRRGDNIDFAHRLEEIINRTNQLNYFKSRVEPGSMPAYLSRTLDVECYSVAVWDKFGYYGIVGFASVENWKHLKHFAFSCRIMHMGIEQWVLAKLAARFSKLDLSQLDMKPLTAHWLSEVAYADNVRAEILRRELSEPTREADIRVMASCQSGSISHFSGLNARIDFDNAPRQFELAQVLNGAYKKQTFPRNLIYGAFTDYADPYWPGTLTTDLYHKCVEEFCEFISSQGCRMLAILPPYKLPEGLFRPDQGMTRERIQRFNEVWASMPSRYSAVDLLSIDDILATGDIIDCRHYDVPLLQKLGRGAAAWIEGYNAEVSQSATADSVVM